ncbi:MAG: MBL fold metallo-hydrolase [Nitrospinota bacterium]|nr:MBL fold metallo-hydrolase [Nitrospinota bacterium]
MKPILHPSLVNDPLGDPGLFVQFLYEKRAFLFDLGDLSPLTNADLLKVTHVFVSHTHIDHFIGFDRFLRIVFGRDKTITLYGPENFIANVEGKLAGFTWNLVDRYEESLTLEVVEVRPDRLRRATFRAIEKFQRSDERDEPFDGGVILDEPALSVSAAILEHRVPCLGFALKEKFHVNINKDGLTSMQLEPGEWLNRLKQNIYEGASDETSVQVPVTVNGTQETQEFALGTLKEKLVTITEGQKIAYVTDTVYTPENVPRIVELVREADLLFCESPFIAEEEDRALERRHLTTRQAGLLAREAGVKQLQTFHYSKRHSHQTDLLVREAQETFRGE